MVDITATITQPADITVTLDGGVINFLGLTDTPTTYLGEAGKVATVNVGETALEFTTPGAVWGGITGTLSNQTDLNTALGLKADDSDLTSHTGDATIHFIQSAISIPASQISDFDTEVSNNSSVVANTAKVTNVSTNLSEGTNTETTVDVNSSDGTNATLVSASTLRAGLLTKSKFDEIVLNNAKVTNATHTGDVTGSTSLTIGVDKVKDTMIDFGTGASQVSTADIPEQTNLYYTESRVTANTNVSSNTTHRGLTNNPHSVDKTDVGLSNVANVDTTNASNISSGTLSSSLLPPIALTTVQLAANQVAQLALTTEEGDVVVRTDEEKSYMRNSGLTGTMTDFTQLQNPTDLVLSVNGETGTVILTTGDISEDTNSNYVSDAELVVIGNTSGTNSGDQDISGIGTNTTSIAFNTTHRGSSGTDHSDVVTNTTHRGLTNDPHNVTSTQVGLGSVSNVATSDTAYNPTSWNTNLDSATKNAIRDKIETMDTAIGLNTAKVSNANHTGDATGSTALTLATVNSNVGSFTNADITVNAKGLITAAADGSGGGGITWNEVTGTSQSGAVDNGYITNNAGLVTVTLPDTAVLGSVLRIAGNGAGGWKLAQNASEIVHFGNSTTTTGVGGSLASTLSKDAIELVCVVANTEWSVISSVGNITIV